MSIKINILTLFLLLLTSCIAWSQPILNERVNLQPTNYTSISNIEVANDSTYIMVAGGYDNNIDKTYIKIIGTDNDLNVRWAFKIIDSIGNNTPSTLDDSFTPWDVLTLTKSIIKDTYLYSFNKNGSDSVYLIRFNTEGIVLDTGIFNCNLPPNKYIVNTTKATEDPSDSSIYLTTDNIGSYNGSNEPEFTGLKISYNFDQYHVFHYQELPALSHYQASSRNPFRKYKDSLILFGGIRHYTDQFIPNTVGSPKRKYRAFVRLCKMDGTPILEWVDTNYMSIPPMGIVPLQNGNIMVVNSYGNYYRDGNAIRHGMKIFCLDSTLNQLWEKRIDTVDLLYFAAKESKNMILTKDSSLIIVGRDYKTSDYEIKPPNNWQQQSYGRITKVNQQGEVLWDRYHYNLPYPEQPYGHEQYLRDIRQTPDSGYIAVGTITKTNDCQAGIIPCQFGWVLKTDKYGCIVPGCHLETEEPEEPQEPQDTTSPYKPTAPILLLYPNPANDVVHVYFRSSAFTDQGSIKIIDMQGNTVKDFTVFKNDITYSVPVHDLAQGTYIIQYMTPDHTFKAKKLVITR